MGSPRGLALGWGLLLAAAPLMGCPVRPTTPPGEVKVGARPLALIIVAEPFTPWTLSFTFDGDVVSADASAPVIHTVTHDELAPSATTEVPEPSAGWRAPQLSVGRGGEAYLLTASQALYAVDLEDVSLTSLGALPEAPVAFIARRDASGVAWADAAGAIHLLDASGVENGSLAVGAGEKVEALASAVGGDTFAVVSVGGVCSGVRVFASSGATLVPLTGLAPPCSAALDRFGQQLWVAGQGAEGAALVLLEAPGFVPAAKPWTLSGMQPTAVRLSDDGSKVALLGAPPGATVAEAEVSALLGGVPGALQLVSANQLTSASDARFDDSGTLYVADPLAQSVGIVR